MNYISGLVQVTGQDPLLTGMLILLVVWVFFWKGLALWHAAKNNERGWFLALLILNTMGILEIVYLFGVRKLTTTDLIPKK